MSPNECARGIVVVGATGLVGHHVVDGLIRAGRRVRAVSRHSRSGPPGVTPCPADVRDAEAFRSVLPGADGIFLNLPPTLQEQDLARIGADITEAGIPITVLLSSDLVGSDPGSVMAASHQREETVLGSVLASIRDDGKRPITLVQVSAEEDVALLVRRLPDPIARQKVAMRAAAPRSIADCPDLPLGKERTPYAAWAAANVAAFGVEGR